MARETLTREQIVRTAVDLLDEEGLEGFSLRQLGRRLGTAATAVYWHVKNKEDLLVLAGDAVWAEIELPDLTAVEWRTAATSMATGMYEMVVRHPWLVPAMSTQLMYGPTKARHDDHALALYESAGFTGQDADQAVNVVFTFVLGMALGAAAEAAWRARLRRTGGDEEQQVRDKLAEAIEIAMQFPRLRARSETSGAGDQADTAAPGLEFGLQTILDGLQARL